MDKQGFRQFVVSVKWRVAKTYAHKAPHEYIVKDKLPAELQPVFEDAVRFVRVEGFEAQYSFYTNIYYILGDYYYWTMGAPVEKTTVLNRAKIADYALIGGHWVWRGSREDL